MALPRFCYQKAFWVVVGLLITSGTTYGGMLYGEIQENETKINENKIELAKQQVSVELVPRIYENQIIICTALKVDCR